MKVMPRGEWALCMDGAICLEWTHGWGSIDCWGIDFYCKCVYK